MPFPEGQGVHDSEFNVCGNWSSRCEVRFCGRVSFPQTVAGAERTAPAGPRSALPLQPLPLLVLDWEWPPALCAPVAEPLRAHAPSPAALYSPPDLESSPKTTHNRAVKLGVAKFLPPAQGHYHT